MQFSLQKKQLAVLIDPDKGVNQLADLLPLLQQNPPSYIFIGGSMVSGQTDTIIAQLQSTLRIPVILFPGNVSQFSDKADALLFLSLISGRNAEYLIGQHVLSSIRIKRSGIPVIPTGYILVEGGKTTSVEYISNTRPIPSDKNDLAIATALAGQYLGMQAIYLEAGSGANKTVPTAMISAVKAQLDIPLLVGGGIKTPEAMLNAFHAGADVVVIGNALEENPALYTSLIKALS